jgi:hypothetical protein
VGEDWIYLRPPDFFLKPHALGPMPTGLLAALVFRSVARNSYVLIVKIMDLLYNLTSTYFEGVPPGGGKRRPGYSRDKRPDCVQVVIALVITPQGFPIAYEVMAGNTSEETTLKSFLEKIEKQYGKMNRTWVMDRGIPSEENLREMRTAEAPIPNPTNHLTSALGLSRLGSNYARQTLGENLPLALPISAAETPEAKMKANGLALPRQITEFSLVVAVIGHSATGTCRTLGCVLPRTRTMIPFPVCSTPSSTSRSGAGKEFLTISMGWLTDSRYQTCQACTECTEEPI